MSYSDEGRYEALKRVGVRQDLYGQAIRGAINRIVQIESYDPDGRDARYVRDMDYLAQIHGSNDITLSPDLVECIGKFPFEDFKKWADWDKKQHPNTPISARTVDQIARSIVFFIVYVLPYLL